MVLLPILLFTFISSVFALSFLIFLFLAHRLYLHVTINDNTSLESLKLGAQTFAEETRSRLDLSAFGVKGKVRWADGENGQSGKWVLEQNKTGKGE